MYQMSNAFIIIKMCYVDNQWYDISCATLYDISCATLYIRLMFYLFITIKFLSFFIFRHFIKTLYQ